jgi:hypothetical protein
MNPWGGIPLIAAALLGGGVSAPAAAVHQGGAAISAAVASPPISIPAGAPTPVLQQTGGTWETTVLLSSVSPACGQLSGVHYWLVTTAPDRVIHGSAPQPTSTMDTDATGGYGSTCQVVVTFGGLAQVPRTATLLIDQAATPGTPGTSSPVMLAVSRNVTLNDYLVIPAVMGGSVTIATLFLSVVLVRRYDRKRKKRRSRVWDWLMHPILGSGAWTANDSWATNISTGLVVVSTVLAAVSADNSLFPGVAIDRFVIVNIVAGFFVAAAPVVFGILYSWLTAVRPGLIADATVQLPSLHAATISVPSGASITLAADTGIKDDSGHWAKVRGGGSYQIAPGATIQVAAGVQAIAGPCHEAAKLAVTDVRARDALQRPADLTVVAVYAIEAIDAAGAAGAEAAVRAGLQAASRGAGPADDAGVQAGLQALRLAVEQAVAELDIPEGKPPTRRKITAALGGDSVRTAAANVVRATAGPPGSNVLPATAEADVTKIIEAMQDAVPQIGDLPTVYNAMAYSGTADIGVLPGSVLQIDKWAGTLTIQGSDVVAQPPSPPASPPAPSAPPRPAAPDVQLVQLVPAAAPGPSDAPLDQPVFISAAGGAKVTVTGAADITLPKDTQASSPQGGHFELRKSAPLLVPQGTNVIVANLGILLFVNLLTMFGIGAELGIASVLADFSDATGYGHFWTFVALAAVAALVIAYAATATRTMADPQPGSSISSQAGSSFTL